METLLDFNLPMNIVLFDQAVQALTLEGNLQANSMLVTFQDHPLAWTRVDAILEQSTNHHSKLLALNILEQTVKFKWAALPQAQRDAIKTYIVNLIIKLSSDPANLTTNKENSSILSKLNMVLVQVVKHEWPNRWPKFIEELVSSSKTSQSLCANNMHILRLLSEEIFEYGTGQMTSEKMKNMKKNLNAEFTHIYQLCEYILDHSNDATLLSTTLSTLVRFLQWIPIGYIFETKLLGSLVVKFLPIQLFQNNVLECLTEIANLTLKDDDSKYTPKMVEMFFLAMSQVSKLITPDTDLARVYSTSSNEAQAFLRQLSLFLSSFLKNHVVLLENGDDNTRQALIVSLNILLRLSRIDDVWIFKVCLDYWNLLVADLYNTQRLFVPRPTSSSSSSLLLGAFGASKPSIAPRLQLYSGVLSQLRVVMISKMAKPEEVLIVEDENGEIIREQLKDTDSITLYKSMREGLIYLTHLDPEDTQKTMLAKLARQVDNSEWSWNNLNTLCWAIGSTSGALSEPAEKTFLVKVIKDLLGMCEAKRGKDHKAVIASNIMYVVGQYPRFLRQHWKFLKTVVNKLFEFMHETHPGVQDMSVDTFLKIARKCRKKFVVTQPGEVRPFIVEILEGLPVTIKDLEAGQIYVFYEACGEIIQAEADADRRQALIFKLMELPNTSWSQIITNAKHSTEQLWDSKTVKQVSVVLKTNSRAAQSIGSGYIVQLANIYVDMLQLYKMYSAFISQKIAAEGVMMTKTAQLKNMRSVKKDTLNLIRTFVSSAADSDTSLIVNKFLPELLEPVLDDYKQGVPDARESEVLLLFATFTERLKLSMAPFLPAVFEATFQCTLDMITTNFEVFPDHRINFFKLLLAINQHAFPSLLRLNSAQFQLVMDSIVWAIKHLERNIAETGLQMVDDLIANMSTCEVSSEFFKTYYVSLLQDVLGVLTDSFHKPGFRLQATILARLFQLVETGLITVPLWLNAAFNPSGSNYPNNLTYVREITGALLRKAFANLTSSTIDHFVLGLFQLNNNIPLFKAHLRDFLVQIKEFGNDEDSNKELFSEEDARQKEQATQAELQRTLEVPGLIYSGPSAHLPVPVADDNYQAVSVDESDD